MIRLYLLLLLTTLPMILLSQEDTVFILDSSYSYYMDFSTDVWIPEERKICTYHGNGYLSERIFYRWDMEDSSWYWTDRFLFTYDNGKLSDRFHYESRILVTPDYDTLSYNHRTVYNYDVYGNPVDSTSYWWDTKTGDWVKSWFFVITYDADGNKTEETGSRWDLEISDWVLMDRQTYAYDMNGNKTEEISYQRNFDGVGMVKYQMRIFFYDAQSNLTMWVEFSWDSRTRDWIRTQREVFTYDVNGNITEILVYIWNSRARDWKLNGRLSYQYDDRGNITEESVYLWRPASGDWELHWGNSYTYDLNGNMTQHTYYYVWDSSADIFDPKLKTVFFWSEIATNVSDHKTDPGCIIYPNPFTDYTTVRLPDKSQVQKIDLIDINGRKIRSINNIYNHTVTIYRDDLPSGIYFIRIHSDDIDIRKLIIR